VQPIEGGKYEILSGHNRVEGAKTVGLKSVPAVVKENLSEEEAEIYVVETNLIQRGFNELAISEKANILGYRYSKMFSQGKRNDIIDEINRLEGKESTYGPLAHRLKSRDILAQEYSLSSKTISRLLRINKLIEPFKKLTDDKTMPLRVAVELSYIPTDGQTMLYDVITAHNKKLNINLSKEVRKLFEDDPNTSHETLENLLIGEKSVEEKTINVPIRSRVYSKYFDKKTSKEDVATILEKALDMYFEKSK
jgi:ParB family chromosome partitioning protein